MLKFFFADFPAARTAFIFRPFGTAEIPGAVWYMGGFQRIPTMTAFDFSGQGAAIVNDASDFAGTNGCYLYQGRDVKEDKDRCLKDQILVIAPHEALISSDTWLKCRKKLMANTTFQQGRKPKNTWLAGKIKCGHCGSLSGTGNSRRL